MILYNKGQTAVPFDLIALKHWNIINPITADGNYNKTESLIGRITTLKTLHEAKGNRRQAKIYKILLHNNLLQKIVLAQPHKMLIYNKFLNRMMKKHNLFTNKFFTELLDKAFQYDNFRSNGKFEQIFSMLHISVCPYCNQQDVFKDNTTGLLIISCDHYFDKASYPYLCMSFFNLIPVCKICNESYKRTKSFSLNTHIHPYVDDYNSFGAFDHDFVDGASTHNISFVTVNLKVQKSNQDFGILERYSQQSVKSISKGIFYTGIEYNDTKKHELADTWELLNLVEVEKKICQIKDIPFYDEEIRKISLGKLKRDLAKKHGILNYSV